LLFIVIHIVPMSIEVMISKHSRDCPGLSFAYRKSIDPGGIVNATSLALCSSHI